MTNPAPNQVGRILRFSLTSADAERLSGFYTQAFGFRCIAKRRDSGADFERMMAVPGGATTLTLMLGREQIELVEFDCPGRSYPEHATSADLVFQHFALVVTNMEAAYRRLLSMSGWAPISTSTPEQLPAASGNVTAFKFRDPEGHPLELLAFPTGTRQVRGPADRDDLFLSIDHSAISVRDSAVSLAFYRGLGLRVIAQTMNLGPEQQRLDALSRSDVQVTAMAPREAGLHLELLCYQSYAHQAVPDLRNNDVAATRTVFETGSGSSVGGTEPSQKCVRDPDGHHIQMVCAAAPARPAISGPVIGVSRPVP